MTTRSLPLPEHAQDKLSLIEDAEVQAQTLVLATTRRISELERATQYAPDNPNAAGAEREIQRLRKLLITQQRRHMESSNLAAKIRRWLQTIPANASFQRIRTPRFELKKGETVTDAVKRLRENIVSLQLDLREIQNAPLPFAEIKARARAYVETLAASARPRISVSNGTFEMSFETKAFALAGSLNAILAWLDQDAFLKRIETEIDMLPQPVLALSEEEKASRLQEVQAALFKLELQEEAAIVIALESGIELARRPDTDPAAVLGLVLGKATTRDAA